MAGCVCVRWTQTVERRLELDQRVMIDKNVANSLLKRSLVRCRARAAGRVRVSCDVLSGVHCLQECHRCGTTAKSMPALKGHLEKCKAPIPSKG